MVRRKSTPVKHNSPKRRFAGRRMRSSRKAIPGLNYSRHRLVMVRDVISASAQLDVVVPW